MHVWHGTGYVSTEIMQPSKNNCGRAAYVLVGIRTEKHGESRHAAAVLGSGRFRRVVANARGDAGHNLGCWRDNPRKALLMPHEKEKSRP